jgi:ornithine cyclodeaminase/alanine dehydrogenase-like protein (mu-crystallin family)
MDSIEITALRTAAATAVAARHLARPDARRVTILGCGTQGRAQLRALTRVCQVERAILHDQNPDAAERMAAELTPELGIEFEVVPDAATAVAESLICVACTPAREPIVRRDAVRPGTFIAAVGADAEGKQELEAALFADCTIVVDLLEQCATIGDLHHALDAGIVNRGSVHAELGEIVAGRRPGRRDPDERIIFDSTGLAFQDAAAAGLVFERLQYAGGGTMFDFMGQGSPGPGVRLPLHRS